MRDEQWQDLVRVLRGERVEPLPVGLIIDSPWLPGWADMTILDYFSSEQHWLAANLKAEKQFPDIWFLPGFWAEYGMCTETSAFGVRCVFPENEFPFAEKAIHDFAEIDHLRKPDCRTDGLLPMAIKRLVHARKEIERHGHRIRVATCRGPLNVASFLVGHTELLMAVKTDPEQVHKLLEMVTEFLIDWLQYQRSTFDSIDGFLVLDDLMGFLGEDDFCGFALPYFQRIFASLDVSLKALHNDARGLITAKYLSEIGANLFNFSFEHSMEEIRTAAGEGVTLLGNIPPRDVLAVGTPDDVRRSVAESLDPLTDRRRIIVSCGGGTPPAAPTENIETLREAASRA